MRLFFRTIETVQAPEKGAALWELEGRPAVNDRMDFSDADPAAPGQAAARVQTAQALLALSWMAG